MTGDTTEITRRRLLGGLVTVAGASAAGGAGTTAYFSDREESAGNTVRAGTLTLEFGGSAAFDFSTALAPTQSTSDAVTLVSSGTLDGSVDVDVSYGERDASNNDADVSARQVAENLTVRTLQYGNDDLLDGQGLPAEPTLHDLANNAHGGSESTQNDLTNLADPTADGTQFTVELALADVGNEFQSDGVTVTFEFHLNQHDGQ